MSQVTRLLDAAATSDHQAAADLLPLVYDELRKLATVRLASESPGHTLDATAIVHEAYLRLVGDQRFDNRGHFFAAAAEAMRRLLVNHARDRNRLKRGGGRVRLELLDQVGSLPEDLDLVLSLDEPLLLKGYEGMTVREKTIPPAAALRISEALDRLIELYTATNKPDEVKTWQAERANYPKDDIPK